jgi:hypothetical protein
MLLPPELEDEPLVMAPAVKAVYTVIVKLLLEVTVAGLAQAALEVITQVITSPFAGV